MYICISGSNPFIVRRRGLEKSARVNLPDLKIILSLTSRDCVSSGRIPEKKRQVGNTFDGERTVFKISSKRGYSTAQHGRGRGKTEHSVYTYKRDCTIAPRRKLSYKVRRATYIQKQL